MSKHCDMVNAYTSPPIFVKSSAIRDQFIYTTGGNAMKAKIERVENGFLVEVSTGWGNDRHVFEDSKGLADFIEDWGFDIEQEVEDDS